MSSFNSAPLDSRQLRAFVTLARTGSFTGAANYNNIASSTITDAIAQGGGSVIGTGGVVKSFSANASYSGTVATAVPAPGAIALAGLAGLISRRRRA